MEPIAPPEVFIDSGAFIALHVPTDAHHQAAISRRDETLQYARLFTSSVVVSETVAHIQHDGLLDQRSLDNLLHDFLRAGKWISLLPVEDEVLLSALRMVKEKKNTRFSLVDATNIVLMEKHRIDWIFSFDGYYDSVSVQRGYSTRYLQRLY